MKEIFFKPKVVNKFDKYLEFKFAKIDDLSRVRNFYKSYWPYKNLITENPNFLLYEFGNNLNLNFLIAENKKTGFIESIIGFYFYSNDPLNKHVCGSMSLVKPKSKFPLLGVETLRRLKELTNCVSYCGTNTNVITMLPLVKKYLNHHTAKMNHYFILNSEKKSFEIAIPDGQIMNENPNKNNKYNLKPIKNITDIIKSKIIYKSFKNLPYKSLEYISKKYLLHPIYNYDIYLVIKNNICESIIITRIVNYKNACVLRVIDFIGDYKILPLLDGALNNIIIKNNYEYVDIISNLPCELFQNTLFIDKSKTSSIIPHYFEPFIKKNIEIFYESNNDKLYFFKGDADGDRPNIWDNT